MHEVSFSQLVIVAAIAFLVPLLLGLVPGLRLPAVVLEIGAGILVGPSVLGWVRIDPAIQALSLLGLAFLLLLAGLEVDFERLRGRLLVSTTSGFALSLGLAGILSLGLAAVGLVEAPLFLAIVLSATALGVVLPVLKDAGESETDFGQLVIAGASIADFGTIIVLSLFFSREGSSPAAQLVLVAGLAALAVATIFALDGFEHWRRLSAVLLRLQDTTSQVRVRGAFLLLALFAVLADRLGLEVILGAFLAGAALRIADRDEAMTHPLFRAKLEAAGFGVFIPVFFVASGLRFDLRALLADPMTLARVPLLLGALIVARGLPAVLYRSILGARRSVAAGLLQATSLSFIVVAAQIGMELGLISSGTGAALVSAGLLSVVLFPLGALTILATAKPEPAGSSVVGIRGRPRLQITRKFVTRRVFRG